VYYTRLVTVGGFQQSNKGGPLATLNKKKCPQSEVEAVVVVVAGVVALHSSILEVLALKLRQLFPPLPTKEVVAGGEVGHKEVEAV
jgi:hypothetical protein